MIDEQFNKGDEIHGVMESVILDNKRLPFGLGLLPMKLLGVVPILISPRYNDNRVCMPSL